MAPTPVSVLDRSPLDLPRSARSRRLGHLLAAFLLAAALVFAAAVPAWAAYAAPKNLKATGQTASSVSLSWSAVSGAPKYRVQYSTSSKMSSPTYLRFTGTTADIGNLKPGTKYYFKVRVISADGDNLSSYTSAVSATTDSGYASPSGLKVTSRSFDTVSLSWSARGTEDRYRIQYSTSASMSNATYVRVTGTAATVDGLKASTTYYFKVRVITENGTNLSDYSSAVSSTTSAKDSEPTTGTAPLRVASYNVKCFNCDSNKANEGSWAERRGAIVDSIKDQNLDVIGVQEVSQAWLSDNLSQFEDLRNRLGDPWKLTNANRNNCVKATTPTNCQYKDQGASKGTKIFYDSDKVEMLDNGSKLLPSVSSDAERYMAWAVLKQKSTGKKFFFVTAHLDPNKDWDLHKKEATVLAEEIEKRNTGNLPTLITGDMNAHKNTKNTSGVSDNPVARVIVNQYGYIDPLGNASGTTTNTVGATVEKRINTWLNSYNDFNRAPNPDYYGRRPNGTYIDYIFTTKMRVSEWETVAKLDANRNLVGLIPSDHHMVRATVWLP